MSKDNVDDILQKKMFNEFDEDPAIQQRWATINDIEALLLETLPRELLVDLIAQLTENLTPEEKHELSNKLMMNLMLKPVKEVMQGTFFKNENGEGMIDLAKMKENFDKNPFFQHLNANIKDALNETKKTKQKKEK